MKANFTVLNFSGIYDEESFYRVDKGSSFYGEILDFKWISGTNCMCDDEAKKEIKRALFEHAISKFDGLPESDCMESRVKGIHFIDSGNYHYMSALFLEEIREPFSLVVLDHHPDMQPSMFGQILSCGGWVKEVLDNNPYVRDVHVIGADRGLIEKLLEEDRAKVKFYDREDVVKALDGDIENVDESEEGDLGICLPDVQYPVYLSIDKDVISGEEITTNWDQGEFTADEVMRFTKALLMQKEILGVDICGECSLDQEGVDITKAIEGNDFFNKEMLRILNDNVNMNEI